MQYLITTFASLVAAAFSGSAAFAYMVVNF